MSPEIRLTPRLSKALAPITPEIDQAVKDIVDKGRIELAREQSETRRALSTFNRTGRIVTVNL